MTHAVVLHECPTAQIGSAQIGSRQLTVGLKHSQDLQPTLGPCDARSHEAVYFDHIRHAPAHT